MDNYNTIPLKIREWTDLDNFDEYEAKAAGWPQEIITAALREIQRRELDTIEAEEALEFWYLRS